MRDRHSTRRTRRTRSTRSWILVSTLACGLLVLWTEALAGPLDDPRARPGPFEVETELGVWIDDAREGRQVPWKLYLPRREGAAPIVVWSHGAGGSREGASYLGEHLASHGFAVFHLQHAGSDVAVLREHGVQGMLREVRHPQVSIARFGDVPFAVARIREMAASAPLDERLDAARMGISGHSFGAITTLVAAGQRFPDVDLDFSVPHFRGAFAMSPSPPRNVDPGVAFADMSMPIFHLTGTDDGSPIGDQTPEDRQTPFRIIDDVDQYLLVLDGGVHMTFSGRDAGYEDLALHHDLVRAAAVAFWQGRLTGDAEAQAWLDDGGFAQLLGDAGTFEVKKAE